MRIAVCSTDAIFRESLACLLTHSGGFQVAACAGYIVPVGNLQASRIDLVLITEDLLESPMLPAIKKAGTPVLLLQAGHGHLSPPPYTSDLVSREQGVGALLIAIRKYDSGNLYQERPAAVSDSVDRVSELLTTRELQIAKLVAQGLRDREIAQIIGTGEHNVKATILRARKTLGCKNRVELALIFAKENTYTAE